MPVNFDRFHSPLRSAAWAGLTWRAAASSRAIASSAALTMLEVGALTTMTPDWVAAWTSTLSRPTPARATTCSRGDGERLGVHLGRGADQDGVHVDDRGEQLGAVGAVAVPDLEVGAERLHGGGAELFGDQDDRTAVGVLTAAVSSGRVSGTGGAETAPPHDAVPAGLYRSRPQPSLVSQPPDRRLGISRLGVFWLPLCADGVFWLPLAPTRRVLAVSLRRLGDQANRASAR